MRPSRHNLKPERCVYCEFEFPDGEKIASLGDVQLLVCEEHEGQWQLDLLKQTQMLNEEINRVAQKKREQASGLWVPPGHRN